MTETRNKLEEPAVREQITDERASLRTAAKEEYGPSLGELLLVIWKRLWIIVLVAVLLAGGAVGFSLAQTPVYEASIKILVGQEQQPSDNPGTLGGELQGLQQIARTMAEAVETRPVAEDVIRRLGLRMTPEDLLGNLNGEQVRATQFIEVKYRDTSPERAQLVANAIGEVFSERVSEVSPSASAITATVWERAEVPDDPVSPQPVRNGLAALALGAMLGVALAFLAEYLDYRRRGSEGAERISGVPDSGVIPEFEVPKGEAPKAQKGGD